MAARIITEADLVARWGDQTLRATAQMAAVPSSTPEAVVAACILLGEAEVFSYLADRYTDSVLPAVPGDAPMLLKTRTAEVVMFAIAARAYSGGVLGTEFQLPYDNAIRWLRDVRANRASLQLGSAPSVDNTRPEILMSKTAADLVMETELD